MKYKYIVAAVLVPVAALGAYFALRPYPRVPMERYIPANAIGFIEIDSVGDVVSGLTGTSAWRDLAPALGISSQISQLGSAADFIGRTGLGPAEAVILGRSQYAAVVTGLDAESSSSEDRLNINLRPRFCLIAETHSKPEVASRLVKERTSIIAHRIFGESVSESSVDYAGDELLIEELQGTHRKLVSAASGSLILLGNDVDSLKSCLDTIRGRSASLAADPVLTRNRSEVDRSAAVFAFVTASGIEKLLPLALGDTASRFTTNADRIALTAGLSEHLSKQAITGFLYSQEFSSGGTTEKYLTALKPEIAGDLAEIMRPDSRPDAGLPMPEGAQYVTRLSVKHIGDLPDRILRQLSRRMDLVAGLAMREFVKAFHKGLGLDVNDSIGDAVGSDVTVVQFGGDEPTAMLIDVRDRERLLPLVNKYLTASGYEVSSENQQGADVMRSTNPDGRAAVFLDNTLVLCSRDQINKILGAGNNKSSAVDASAEACLVRSKNSVREAGEMMLAIARLTRVSDGSEELLDPEPLRSALGRIPKPVSFTQFRESGVYTESRSAFGSFALIGLLSGEKANSRP